MNEKSNITGYCRFIFPDFSFSTDFIQSICLDLDTLKKMALIDHFLDLDIMGLLGFLLWLGLLPTNGLALGSTQAKGHI